MTEVPEDRLEDILAIAARCRWISVHALPLAFGDDLPVEVRARLRSLAREAESFRSYLLSHRIIEEESP